MRRLERALAVGHAQAIGHVELLLHFAQKFAPAGDVGRFTDEDLEDALAWDGERGQLVSALVTASWLDEDPRHRLIVHGWSEHADDAVNMNLARAGQLFADGTKPRMGRLTKEERERAEERFASALSADAVRTPGAHQAHAVSSSLPSPPPPSPPPPSPPPPSPVPPDEEEPPPAGGSAPAAPESPPGPAGATKKRSKTAPPPAWALAAAEALALATKRRWPGTHAPTSLVTWAREIARCAHGDVTSEHVIELLRWYIDEGRDDDKFLPEARAGASFAAKYDQIVAARIRSANSRGGGAEDALADLGRRLGYKVTSRGSRYEYSDSHWFSDREMELQRTYRSGFIREATEAAWAEWEAAGKPETRSWWLPEDERRAVTPADIAAFREKLKPQHAGNGPTPTAADREAKRDELRGQARAIGATS